MNSIVRQSAVASVLASLLITALPAEAQPPIPNRLIDYRSFLKDAKQAEELREGHRVPEDQFLEMMSEPGVVLLDARSAAKFQLRHLKGAVNLSFPDFTAAELARTIP